MSEMMLSLAQNSSGSGGALGGLIGIVVIVVYLAILILVIAGFWKMFEKAGQPGWAILIPIYNIYVLLKVAGRPGWWLILLLIPIVSLVIAIIVWLDIAKAFGKSSAFAVGLILLSPIFVPILGFGSAQYQGPAAE
jgi:uncharacterized membrane protein YhaH (DUF805 family)